MRDLNGNVLSSLATQFDSDAAAFITAANITSTTQITAINNLSKELKRNNLWDKMQVIYPVVGGNGNSHKYNLKDPRDLDAAYRLAFSGTWVHSSTGMKPQTQNVANRANSFYNPLSASSLNDAHLSVYVRDIAIGTTVVVGAYDGVNWFQLNASSGASNSSVIINSSTSLSITLGNTVGLMLGSRTASNFTGFYVNGVLSGSSAGASTTRPNLNVWYGARNDSGSFNFSSNQEIAFSSIGLGLTASDVANLNRIVEAYQTTLGRQVVAATIIPRIESSIPTRLFGPRELFGSSLLTHVDTMDYKNFSTDRFNKVNPPNTGETIIQSIFDISPYGRRYNLPSSYTNVTETATTWTTTIPLTTTTQGFSASSFDTNKGTFPRFDNYLAGQGQGVLSSMISPYANFRNLAPNSAFTLCNWISHQGSSTNTDSCMGIGISSFPVPYILGLEVPQLFFGGNMLLTVKGVKQAPRYLPTLNNTLTTMHLITVTGYNYYWYTNNVLYSSGTITGVTLYPFTTTGSTFFYLNSPPYIPFFGTSTALARTLEGFYATEYTTPEQVNLLYNYFIIKTKNKLGKFR